MNRRRKQYSSDLKAKLSLAVLKGDQTTSEEIAARFEIHSTMVRSLNALSGRTLL